MLLPNINWKPYMESPIVPSHLTSNDLERSKSRLLRFQSLISQTGAKLGPMLLLNFIRKQYMGSPMAPSHRTLSDLEMSNSRSHRFQTLIQCVSSWSWEGAKLDAILLQLNINRKPYMLSLMAPIDLTLSDLERLKSRYLTIEDQYSGLNVIYFQRFPNINQIHKWSPHTTQNSYLQERKKRKEHITEYKTPGKKTEKKKKSDSRLLSE